MHKHTYIVYVYACLLYAYINAYTYIHSVPTLNKCYCSIESIAELNPFRAYLALPHNQKHQRSNAYQHSHLMVVNIM